MHLSDVSQHHFTNNSTTEFSEVVSALLLPIWPNLSACPRPRSPHPESFSRCTFQSPTLARPHTEAHRSGVGLQFLLSHSNEKIKGPGKPTSQPLPMIRKSGWSGAEKNRKDKGDGGRSIILKVVCVYKVACERWCVTKLCAKDGVWQSCVCVCERWCVTKLCVKDGVLQSCVKDGVWQSCVWKMVCDKVVCVWQSCVWKSCVWQSCVCEESVCVCVTKLCAKDGVWQSCVWQSCVCVWQSCVCVWTICTDVKLPLVSWWLWFVFSWFWTMFAGGHSISLGLCPTKLPVKWDIQLGQLDVPAPVSNFVNGDRLSQVPACRLNFSFWIMLHLNLSQSFVFNRFNPLYGFRNLNYCRFVRWNSCF